MNKIIEDLEFALALKRPHGSTGVYDYCNYILSRVPTYRIDFCGNIHVDLRVSKSNRTLFTAHVDTVHNKEGYNLFKYKGNFIEADGDVLGADDAAGVSVLLHLIDNEVPAYYIFFQGEEKGGIGSSWLALNEYELLSSFNRAIAFDRKDTCSVITHQGFTRTASDEFAQSLCDQFNQDDRLMYLPDDGGVYTDTAEFVMIIPECTNISVGYYSEHTHQERIDVVHLKSLAETCVRIDWDSLPTRRDPTVVEDNFTRPAINNKYYTPFKKVDNDSYNPSYDYYTSDQDLYRTYPKLFDALERAYQGKPYELIEIIGDYVAPNEKHLIRNSIKPKDVTFELLDQLESMMEQGFNEGVICDFAFDSLTEKLH